MKQSQWVFWLEVVVLVLIILFGVGVIATSDHTDREKMVSIEEP